MFYVPAVGGTWAWWLVAPVWRRCYRWSGLQINVEDGSEALEVLAWKDGTGVSMILACRNEEDVLMREAEVFELGLLVGQGAGATG